MNKQVPADIIHFLVKTNKPLVIATHTAAGGQMGVYGQQDFDTGFEQIK